jgi:Fe-S oxidoreductase
VLFPDTFNEHLDTARSATRVLEAAGFRVVVPEGFVCCGRPLYDYGMLDTAKRLLRHLVGRLRGYARAGIPIVGLEPSCVAALRDELPSMLVHDEDAIRIAGSAMTLAEFLKKHAADYEVLDSGCCGMAGSFGFEADRYDISVAIGERPHR